LRGGERGEGEGGGGRGAVHSSEALVTNRASLRCMDALGRLIIYCPFKPIYFKLFQPRKAELLHLCTKLTNAHR